MGQGFEARCRGCGHAFEVMLGAGFDVVILHCDTCGKEKGRKHFGEIGDIDEDPDRCRCGGTFTFDAPPRCPKCGSQDLEDTTEFLWD